jgi:hypothetical protein
MVRFIRVGVLMLVFKKIFSPEYLHFSAATTPRIAALLENLMVS